MAKGVIVDQEAYRKWVDANPLRKWMRTNHVAIMDAASRMGVSISIIQLWSRGAHTPSPESMAKIAALTETDPKALSRSWKTWLGKRPGAS